MSDIPEHTEDYQYLVGLTHVDGVLLYITTRVVERRGVIVAYRRYASADNETEEQTPIHIKDIERMSVETQKMKSLYGLKQSPRNWNTQLRNNILTMGYSKCKLDNCLYVKGDEAGLDLVVVYVDDIIVLSADEAHISDVVSKLNTEYDMQDLGDLQHSFGIVINRDDEGVRLHQKPYETKIVERFSHLLPKSYTKVTAPLPPSIKLSKESRLTESAHQRD